LVYLYYSYWLLCAVVVGGGGGGGYCKFDHPSNLERILKLFVYSGGGARRRRRRRSNQEEEIKTKVILHDRKTYVLLKRFLPWLRPKYIYDHVDNATATSTNDRISTITSIKTVSDRTLNSAESRLVRSTSLPTNNENSRTSMNKGLHVTRVSRIDKPSSIEGNKNIKYPIRKVDDDDVSGIEMSSIPKTRTASVSVIKLSRSKSLGTSVQIIQAPQSSNTIRTSMISNERPSRIPKRSQSVHVTKVKRFSEDTSKTSIINVIKSSRSISQVSTVPSSTHSRGVTIINAPKTSKSARLKIENKLSRRNSTVTVTKLSRSKSLMTNSYV